MCVVLRRQQKLSATMLLATSTAFAVVPPRRASADRFFGSDKEDEMERLRRENAELKSRLENDQKPSFLSRLFGKKEETALEKQQKALNAEIDQAFKGNGLMGSLAAMMTKSIIGAAGSAMAQSMEEIKRVQDKVAEELVRSGKLDQVTSQTPYEQSYSQINVNGKAVTQVMLTYEASGTYSSGLVRVDARIDERGNIDLVQLEFNNTPLSSKKDNSQSIRDRGGTIIDV